MQRIASVVDDALARGLGSAIAVSVGDAGREVFRLVRGHRWRVPARGPEIDEHTPFDLASLTKPMSTVAIARALPAFDPARPIRDFLPHTASGGTLRDLLEHTAGCAAHVEFFRYLRSARPADPYAALLERAQREPCTRPGPTMYSDLGYIQLGAILEQLGGARLDVLFDRHVATPLGLRARFAREPIDNAVATELDERGLVCGLVHDENCYYGGRICGHAGLFGSLDDVARFAAFEVARPFPAGGYPYRFGWDTPARESGFPSQAGDLWPRDEAVGHTGFTGTSIWLDLPRRRWSVILTNRVHPSRYDTTADQIRALRRAINDVVAAL